MSESSLRRELADAYLATDRRVLGAFRILFGAVVLGDLLDRGRDLTFMYSNDGILSNHFVLFAPQARPQLSLFSMFSTAWEVRVAFALCVSVCLFYMAGLFTRAAQVAMLVVLTSLNARNLMFEDGGSCVSILTATWTLFMPLGDRYSIDSLRRDAGLSIRERIRHRARLTAPHFSLATLAVLLQIAAIYWLNAVHKNGQTWRNGDAVHLVLWQNRVSTSFAAWLARHEPDWLSPVLTYLTLRIEYSMPILVLFPAFRPVLRTLAFALCVALHGGIALVMSLGIFSYAMMSLVALQLPPQAFDFAGRKLPRRLRHRTLRLRTKLVREIARLGFGTGLRRAPPFVARPAAFAREAALAIVLLASTLELCASNRAIPTALRTRQLALFEPLILYPRLLQRWSMFAPDAPTSDGTLVIDARTASGAHVDPFTGKEPDFELIRKGPLPYGIWVAQYLFAIQFDDNQHYRRDLIGYLRNWHRLQGRPESDRIVGFVAYWTSYDAPPRGKTEPGPVEKREVFRWR